MRSHPYFSLIGILALCIVTTATDAKDRDDIKIANGYPIRSLDPAQMTGYSEIQLALSLYEGLTINHPKTLKPLPGVAKNWDISDDGRVYTFHLRKEAQWVKNGKTIERVSAKDFYCAWLRLLRGDVRAPYNDLLHFIKGAQTFSKKSKTICDDLLKNAQANDPKIRYFFELPKDVRQAYFANEAVRFERDVGVKALNDSTLQVTLKSATPYFLDVTSAYFMCPVYRKDLTGLSQYEGPFEDAIVTNGTFYLKKSTKKSYELEKNKRYWDAKNVALNSIKVSAFETPEKALAAYLKGDIDWLPIMPPAKYESLSKRPDFKATPSIITYFYRFNVVNPMFSGKDGALVRKALSLAIDRKKIAWKIVKGHQRLAFSIVPPGFYRYKNYKPKKIPDLQERVKKAKKLLANAGDSQRSEIKELTILINRDRVHRAIAKSIASDWKKLGIVVKLEEMEWSDYLKRLAKKDYQVARSGWIGDFTDPSTFLDMWVTNGENNKTGWSNPRYDRLIKYSQNIQNVLANKSQTTALVKDIPNMKNSIENYLTSKDLEKMWKIRMTILREAEKLLAEEGPVLPIYFYTDNQLWNPKIKGLYGNIRNIHPPKYWGWKPRETK